MSPFKILVPRLYNIGGVSNYYKTLLNHLGSEYKYIYRGKVSKNESSFTVPWRMLKDYALFCRASWPAAKVVVINSSLGLGGFFRDGLYFLIAPRRSEKVLFFHGWNPDFEKKIDTSQILRRWLRRTFLKADHIIVLSSEFKEKLRQWGYDGPVSIETTIVGEDLLEGEEYENLVRCRDESSNINILYLGNISKAKGVWEVLEAYQILCGQNGLQNLKCVMAGAGRELEALKSAAGAKDMQIEFPGYVQNDFKKQVFKNAHLYVFPSAHGEGMPTSVLEAMAFGLPVITTRVGGLPDFFEDGKMGLFLDNREPEHIAEKVRYLLERPELMREISKYNFEYAKEHFYAGKVAKRFEDIIKLVHRNKRGK